MAELSRPSSGQVQHLSSTMIEASQVTVSEATSMGLLSFKWRGVVSLDERFRHLKLGALDTIDEIDLVLVAPGEVLAFPQKSRLAEVAEVFGFWAGEGAHAVTDLTSGWCALDLKGVGSTRAIENIGGIPRSFLKSEGSVSAFWIATQRVIVRTILPHDHYNVWITRCRLHSFPLRAPPISGQVS